MTHSIFMHLPPLLEHSPTLQNSNNTKQYNTYIPQATRQSTKESSKKTYHNQRYKSKQAKTTIQNSLQTATKANNKLEQTKHLSVQQHTFCN